MSANNHFSAHPSIPAGRDILVCVFQRGAADGLNAVVPYSDLAYYQHREDIAVAPPASSSDPRYLDPDFALHPALTPLKWIYDLGNLGLVHATGMPHQIRSHFSAQNLIERGVVQKNGPNTGWLGRHLARSPAASNSAFRAISISGNVPVALSGAGEPLAIDNLNDFGFEPDIIDSGYPQVLANLFHDMIPLAGPANAALTAMAELQAADLPSIVPANGAVYPSSPLGGKMRQAAQLIRSQLPVEVVCIDSGGWDHHENLPTYIDPSLTELAESLEAFYKDMGSGMDRVTVLVYTEFGRRIEQNGSFGTDHGTASLAYLMGAGVKGGKVTASWPGLDITQNEDLQITTDLRSVISELLDKRLGGTDVANVFPGFNGPTDVDLFEPYV